MPDPATMFATATTGLDAEKILEVKPTDVIADIGSGTGALEISMLSKKVPFKKLYAVDVDNRSLEILQLVLDKSKIEGREKVVLVHSRLDDVMLPENSIDVMLLLNTAFFLQGNDSNSPSAKCTSSLYKALKPGGKLHILLRKKQKTDEASISAPLVQAGFKPVKFGSATIKNDAHYHAVFTK